MAEIIKETTTMQPDNNNLVAKTTVKPVTIGATGFQTVEYLTYFFFGALETLLAFRLVLKLLGANIESAFVGFVYGVTGIFIAPFVGIFHRGFAQGVETKAVLEPETLVALIVFAVVAWGIVRLVRIFSGEKQDSSLV